MRTSPIGVYCALATLSMSCPPTDGLNPARAADHHVHLRSEAGAAITAQMAGVQAQDQTRRRATTADDLLAALDSAGVHRGVVLSIAYMFGSPSVDVPDEAAMVRAENAYVARQVAQAPDRLVGACSVNPLADYALDEITWCAADPMLRALKLHFANSGVSLQDSSHLSTLAQVFTHARRLELPVIVHVRPAERYGADDAEAFIASVLATVPDLPVQIAHMAGWGGYDNATDEALGAFISAMDDGIVNRDMLSFDIGAVVFQPAAAGADTALARRVREANAKLAARIREIGVDRVVYATDWPSWPPVPDPVTGIARNIRLIEDVLPLSPAEIDQILSNTNQIADVGSEAGESR